MLRRMMEPIRHRGPDSEGIWVDAAVGVALGHQRLSIVDLSETGHQPMASATGQRIVVFNGEIYNHLEVRKELQRTGHVFRGTSDTEVMLEAIERWGLVPALGRFVGMFALALWDRQENVLHLVRDRMGEKPLYYGWCGADFCFGSELKALRRHTSWRGEIDSQALQRYLQHGYVSGEQSIFRDVYRLSPGEILSLSLTDISVRKLPPTKPFWSFRQKAFDGTNEVYNATPAELSLRLEELVSQAVKMQMLADVPVGAFLSGGVDSSLIVALMQKHSSRSVKTFSIGFEEKSYDEAGFARKVASHLGTDHTELYITSKDALDVIPRMPGLFDEPFSDASQIPTYLVSQLARKQVKVSLSGDGGDELFGGYTRYRDVSILWAAINRIPRYLRAPMGLGITTISTKTWDRVIGLMPRLEHSSAFDGRPGDKLHKLAQVLDVGSLYDLYDRFSSQNVSDLFADRLLGGQTMLDETEPILLADARAWMQAYDAVTYLPNDILVKLDRASMAHSLECRVPLLDYRVVEFSCRLSNKLQAKWPGEKWLLKDILNRHVPQELTNRPKHGFSVPLGTWLRGPLREWAESLLSSSSIQTEILSPKAVQKKWREHLSGERDWQYILWNILMFRAWHNGIR